jgi:predicted nucleotidyltransferase
VTQFSETTRKQIAEPCKKYKIRELSLFGSRVRGEANERSDFDFLVEFFPDKTVTFMTLGAVQNDLEQIVESKVDLVPKLGLKPLIRERVLAEARPIYADRSNLLRPC